MLDDLKTDAALLKAIEAAVRRAPNPEEAERQRVSFIFSAVKQGENLTEARIKEVLAV